MVPGPTAEVLQRALLHQQQRPLPFLLQQTPGCTQGAEDLSLLRRHVKYQPRTLEGSAAWPLPVTRTSCWCERFCVGSSTCTWKSRRLRRSTKSLLHSFVVLVTNFTATGACRNLEPGAKGRMLE